MATKPAKPEAEEGAVAPKKSKKMLIFIIIGVVVLALAAGGAFLLMKKKAKAGEEEGGNEGEEPAKAKVHADKSHPPVFVPLEPFTVNLQAENGEQYLQVVLSLRMSDAKTGEEMKLYMPEIRHRILMLLSNKRASEINSTEGRETLANEIRSETNSVLGYEPPAKKKKGAEAEEGAGGPVVAVFFTSFIVQ